MPRPHLFAPAVALLAAAGAAHAQGTPPQYRVRTLPPIGGMNAVGRAINDLGWVVAIAPGGTVAIHRPGQGWQDIGLPPGFTSADPADITNGGLVVGTARKAATGSEQAWSWQDGQFTVYPPLVPGRPTHASPTNEAGEFVGYGNDGGFTTYKALRFVPPGATQQLLAGVPGGNFALDINNDGVILGTELLGAFLWRPPEDRWYFPPPPGVPLVEFNVLNDHGDAVGMARAGGHSETRSAVVWLDGSGWRVLPRTARRCNARSINNLREVVGTAQDNAGAIGNHAWYWRAGMAQVTPLEYLIADPPGGVFAVGVASDINDSSQVLAGGFIRATGEGFQMVLEPILDRPLHLDLASSVPPGLHEPGVPLEVRLRILEGTASYAPGSARVHYRPGPAGAFTPIALADAGANMHRAELPPAACADSPQFYFTAQATGGGAVALPADAPASVFATQVGSWTTTAVLRESFEGPGMPAGWSATGLWGVGSACLSPGGFCYDGGSRWAYYGIPGQCDFNTGGSNAGTLTAPAVSLPLITPGGEIRLTYCSSLLHDLSHGSVAAELLVNGVVRDTPSWTSQWERRVVNLAAYAGQTVTLEWRFSTGIYGTTERGWHVDNVTLAVTTTGCHDPAPACYANCDGSTAAPALNTQDFSCFLTRYAAGEGYANCDGSTQAPVLNVQDFACFLGAYAAGCP